MLLLKYWSHAVTVWVSVAVGEWSRSVPLSRHSRKRADSGRFYNPNKPFKVLSASPEKKIFKVGFGPLPPPLPVHCIPRLMAAFFSPRYLYWSTASGNKKPRREVIPCDVQGLPPDRAATAL